MLPPRLVSLRQPDHPQWRTLDISSGLVGAALHSAYATLRVDQNGETSYARAFDIISRVFDLPMSAPRRVRAAFLMGMGLFERDEILGALEYLDQALDCATYLRDRAALAELHFFRGMLHRGIGQTTATVADQRGCLRQLIEARIDAPAVEVDARLSLAANLFMLNHVDKARRQISLAERLLPRLGDARRAGATMAWLRGLFYRWDGKPDQAFVRIQAAVAAYTAMGLTLSIGRSQLILADCALDLAEVFPCDPASSARDALLRTAHAAARAGLGLTRDATDEPGEVIALLAQARADRLSGYDTCFVPRFASALFSAEQLGDTALHIQAETALADELAAHGESASARNVYVSAVMTSQKSEAPALGEWARRKLQSYLG